MNGFSSPFGDHAVGTPSSFPGMGSNHDAVSAAPTVNPSFDVQRQLEDFQRSDERRNFLVQNLYEEYIKLQKQYNIKCQDLENEVTSRRNYQERVETLQAQNREYQSAVDSNPFAVALIDGDGAIFEDILHQSGRDGGSYAAQKLNTEIKSYLEGKHSGASHWPVTVYIYAAFDGLGRKLHACGLIDSPSDVYSFARSFTMNQPLFHMIDVGYGKERADHKIREMFRLYSSNRQCKHILFGGCHDNGYLTILEPFRYDTVSTSRITLLEALPAAPAFQTLGFPMVRFDSVFRSQPLPERPVIQPTFPPPQQTMSMPIRPAITPEPATNVTKPAPPRPSSQTEASPPLTASKPATPTVKAAPLAVQTPAKTPAKTPAPSTTPAASSWATVGRSGVVGKNISLVSAKPSPAPAQKFILLNSMDQRLDHSLPKPDRDLREWLEKCIRERGKFCNNWHIAGRCEAQEYGNCQYVHGKQLTGQQLLALRVKARSSRCSNRFNCRNFDCYCGHVCQGNPCTFGSNCTFSDTHTMDRKAVMKLTENGYEVIHD